MISSVQITNDGTSKRSLVTDGTRLYFSEYLSGHSVLRQVSTSGGETAPVPTSLTSADIYDLYPGRSELLLKGMAEGSETEWPLWVLPVPGGSVRPVGNVLAHAATWAPDGKHIVYAWKSGLYECNADGSDSRQIITLPGVAFGPRFLPIHGACDSRCVTLRSVRHLCGKLRPMAPVCMRCCRTGTNLRRNLAGHGRRTVITFCSKRLRTTTRISGRCAKAGHSFAKPARRQHN